MTAAITFTLDLEDHRSRRDGPGRHGDNTRALLTWLAERSVRGTVFIVAEVARTDPELVREVAAHGHEVALHSWNHRPLTEETPERFRDETRRGRALLEDLSGSAVTGYRAPSFSLTPSSRWVVAELAELGFAYSSSVLPARSPLYGYPGLPATPFRWPEGPLELPVPIARLGPWALPYLGGIYLRYLPLSLIRGFQSRASADARPWTYCHPYDFDHEEPFTPIHDAPPWVSMLLWFNRRQTYAKLAAVLEGCCAPPFAELIARGEFESVESVGVG